MILFGELILVLLAVAALCVVRTRNTACQVLALGFYALVLAILFFVFHAPDVGLSQIAVGALALPLMVMLALARIKDRGERQNTEAK